VERKVALGARTNVEIYIMNTKHADGYRIVSEDQQALAFLTDWITFCQELDGQATGSPRAARLGSDPDGALPRLRREAAGHPPRRVHLIWKRCHSWARHRRAHAGPATGGSHGLHPDANLV